MLDGINDLFVSKGKKVVHINLMTDKPDRETLVKLLTGRSGNLRAPVIRKGKKLIVGFDAGVYEEQIAGQ